MSFEYLKYMVVGDDGINIIDSLMREYGDDVWKYAFFLTSDKNFADDVTQEVFLRCIKKINDFRGESSVKSWLFSITRSYVSDHRKSSWVSKVTLIDFFSSMVTSPSAEKVTLDQMEMDEIWKIILGIPIKLREVLVLSVHYGMTMSEMAKLLQISENTVKTRLFRARQKVNQIYSERGES